MALTRFGARLHARDDRQLSLFAISSTSPQSFTLIPFPTAKPARNYRIAPNSLAETRSWRQKAADNLAAIRLLLTIESADRPATEAEKVQLALYVGWGGLKGAFPDAEGRYSDGLDKIGAELRRLLPDADYAAARRSIQYAHFTSETIIAAIWQGVMRFGFEGGRIFEPGLGIGHFLGLMPESLREASDYTGLDCDSISIRIAKLLYPEARLSLADFVKIKLPRESFDLAIGNPPFSDLAISADPDYPQGFRLHDYFLAKSLDLLRPGGLLAFVTTAGTLNKQVAKARTYLADRGRLLGAIRLPNTAFLANAGTEVTSDILFFQKRERESSNAIPAQDWTETEIVDLPHSDGGFCQKRVSRYFRDHPEMILGRESVSNRRYAHQYEVIPFPDRSLSASLAEAIAALPQSVAVTAPTEIQGEAPCDLAPEAMKEGSFYFQSGQLFQKRDGAGHPVRQRSREHPDGKPAGDIARIKALIPIRDALAALYEADRQGAPINSPARAALNAAYDDFLRRFGPINRLERRYRRPSAPQQELARAEAREDARYAGQAFEEGSFDAAPHFAAECSLAEIARLRSAARDLAKASGQDWDEGSFDPDAMPDILIDRRPNIDPFIEDPESYRLRAIERYDEETGEASKTRIFVENAVSKLKTPKIESLGDALLASLNRFGRIDLDYIGKALGLDQDEIIAGLGDAIYLDPATRLWVTRDAYLSGNVLEKLDRARIAAQSNENFRRNVDALIAAQPAPIPTSEISAGLGMPWIPVPIVEEFGRSLGLSAIAIRYLPPLARWVVEGDKTSAAALSQWGTPDRHAIALIQDALNRQTPRIFDTISDGEGKRQILNVAATQAAQDKIRDLKARFEEWIWADAERSRELTAIYNRSFNNLVVREYDGDYLTTPGIAVDWTWRPHQKRVISRIIQSGNTYIAHAVGAGKTSEMIGAVMEMRRLGLIRKAMIAVPNHMLGQFAQEFYQQYPLARIAIADERRFHTHCRRQFIARIANEDLDAVILTHSAFGMIPISEEFHQNLLNEQIEIHREMLQQFDKRDPDTRRSRRYIENALEKLQQRLAARAQKRQDQVYTFEQIGVDFLCIDEAHLFRKLDFATKMADIRGINPIGSKAAFDLYAKARYLESRNPGRSLVLASGTPITNTMAELFTISRYLQPQELVKRDLAHFDAWAGTFGDTVTALEQDPAGGYKSVTRFAKFTNVPELSAMVRQVMDVVTNAQLGAYVTRPQLATGKRQMHLAAKSRALTDYQESLAARMQAIAARSGRPLPGQDILLNVINDGRHAAIDMRLVDPDYPNDPGSKLNLLIDQVFAIWRRTDRAAFHRATSDGYAAEPFDRGPATQLVFTNLGHGARAFCVPDYIARELTRRGIPATEIARIADFKTHAERQRLFNDMNEGKIRILIGSTGKMATGVNVQRRLIAIHNLDPLWYPADDEQRNGRILRQGNANPIVEIHDYSTIGTYDAAMWGLMETKARFIQGFFEGDVTLRNMEDLGQASQYETAKAVTASDPRLLKLTELRQELERARRRRTAFDRDRAAVEARIGAARRYIDYADTNLPKIDADLRRRRSFPADRFQASLDGRAVTSRAEFGAGVIAKLDALLAKRRQAEACPIGEIRGFPLRADILPRNGAERLDEAPYEAVTYLCRAGDRQSEVRLSRSPLGVVKTLEGALDRFEAERDALQTRKAAEIQAIADFTRQLDRRFTGQDEIDRLNTAARHLEIEMAAAEKAASAAGPGDTPSLSKAA